MNHQAQSEKNELSGINVLFINQFDLFMNNSAGITVRDMFGNDYCNEMPKLFVDGNRLLFEQNRIKKTFSFDFKNWKKVAAFLEMTKPDIVYTTASSSKVLLFLIYIKKRLNIPVLMHFFDNWREIGSVRRKNCLLKLLGWPHERALVISDEMNKYYHKRYHGNYTTLMVGTATHKEKQNRNTASNGKIKLMYAGGLHLGRVDALTEIERVVLDEFENVQLVIATFAEGEGYNKYHTRFDESKTQFLIDVKHEEMDAHYAEANALIFVESAPEEKLNYLRYSMSTKIPEYLSSGLPIICYAKPNIACYEYFKNTGSAILASTADEITHAIEKICQDDCSDIIDRARKAAQKDFDRSTQRSILTNIMSGMIYKEKNSKNAN